MTYRNRSFLCLLGAFIALLGLTLPAQPQQVQADATDEFVPDEVVVRLVSTAVLPAVARDYALDPAPLDQFGARPIYRLKILDGTRSNQKVAELQGDGQGRVVFAEPNYTTQAPEGRQKASWAIGGTASQYAGQWAPTMIGLTAAHTVSRGRGTTVAVLDTGVDTTHPALRDHLVAGYDFVDDDSDPREEGIFNPGDPANIAFGHGTHVAGLVALVAPEASIMPVRVLEPDGSGNVWMLAEALRYAVSHGANVINLSLGTTRETELFDDLLKELSCSDEGSDEMHQCANPVRPGVVIVAAAGNGGNTVPEYPAAEAQHELLAVAASTPSDTLAPFSTRGSWIDIAAPGEQIVSTVPGGDYGTWSGTSMAAPLVAGATALIRSHCAVLDARAVAEQIVATAARIPGEVPNRLALVPALQSACFHTFVPYIAAGQ